MSANQCQFLAHKAGNGLGNFWNLVHSSIELPGGKKGDWRGSMEVKRRGVTSSVKQLM